MRRARLRVVCGIAVVGVLLAGLATAGLMRPGTGQAGNVPQKRPNIVFVLTDDLSWNLVRYLPEVRRMQAEGMTFNDYVVANSLCCPSRASILTGRFPHDTGVFTNNGPDGGFARFHDLGQESDTFATALRARGYRTAMMGKYLNGYQPSNKQGGTAPYVPPGWSEWDGFGGGYRGFNYSVNDDRTVLRYGDATSDYATDVLATKGVDFIDRSAREGKPFLLEVSTFAPHSPYTPAPRHAATFPGLTVPRGPAFNTSPTDPPPWLAGRPPLTPAKQNAMDRSFRKRVQSIQAVDDLIAGLRAALEAAGVADDTYVVFSSDNGFHMGEYRLTPGKSTAFDTDVRVPLVVTGPGVPAGRSSDAAVANIDLAPTFVEAGGGRVPDTMDGRSLLHLLRGGSADGWRTANLVEHRGPVTKPGDPDLPAPGSGNPPTYAALRTNTYTYVEYVDGSREYYDLTRDPSQLRNLAGTLDPARSQRLHAALEKLVNCHSGPTCWAAGHI